MKKLTFILLLHLCLIFCIDAQNDYLVLTFSAEDNSTYVQLDSIKIMNRSQDCDTVLYWPDTVLILGSQIGTQELQDETNGLLIYQNYPNPVLDKTTLKLYVPEEDIVTIMVTDITGRLVAKRSLTLCEGMHSFNYTPGQSGVSFVTSIWRHSTKTIRVVSSLRRTGNKDLLDYTGKVSININLRAISVTPSFMYAFGDTLLYIGYKDAYESGKLDTPITHDTSTFQFAYDIPCPGTPTVTYEGQVYNTVQIFNQCWLKENLNVGVMIDSSEFMEDNGIIEKYCYRNETDSCEKYGGLYQWQEMMQYSNPWGAGVIQGICPSGWHIPNNEDWKILEGAVDSQYGIGTIGWDYGGYRGFDAGTNLKTIDGWNNNGNGINKYGFSGLPGGFFDSEYFIGFQEIGISGSWWLPEIVPGVSCTCPYYRMLDNTNTKVFFSSVNAIFNGLSVRCIKDQ